MLVETLTTFLDGYDRIRTQFGDVDPIYLLSIRPIACPSAILSIRPTAHPTYDSCLFLYYLRVRLGLENFWAERWG